MKIGKRALAFCEAFDLTGDQAILLDRACEHAMNCKLLDAWCLTVSMASVLQGGSHVLVHVLDKRKRPKLIVPNCAKLKLSGPDLLARPVLAVELPTSSFILSTWQDLLEQTVERWNLDPKMLRVAMGHSPLRTAGMKVVAEAL